MNDINKFIASLNDNQRKLLIIALVFVVAALLDRLFIAPTMSHLSSIQEDISKEEATIKQDLRFLNYKDRVNQESEEVDPYITKNMLSDNEMIAAFLNKIQNLASVSNINIIKINPMPGEQDVQYWKYQADLDCSGTLSDLVSFMHTINSATDLMKVDKFSFNGKRTDTDEIKATMTIEKIVVPDKPMPPKAPDANATQAAAPASA